MNTIDAKKKEGKRGEKATTSISKIKVNFKRKHDSTAEKKKIQRGGTVASKGVEGKHTT